MRSLIFLVGALFGLAACGRASPEGLLSSTGTTGHFNGGSSTGGGGAGGTSTGAGDAGTSKSSASSSSAAGGSSTGGTDDGQGTSGGGTTGAGGSGGGTVGGTATSSLCDPSSPGDCGYGYVCDPVSGGCSLPGYGEACEIDLGCAAIPSGMSCTVATFSGNTQTLCLVACSGADSSACPYLTSCGDPNLPGYCSPAGSGTCVPWLPCTLGTVLSGTCIPGGSGSPPVCAAAGAVTAPYQSCDPLAANSDSANVCGTGMLCIPSLSAPSSINETILPPGGYCYPVCGQGGLTCSHDEHCDQPAGEPYGSCLPGAPCQLGASKSCTLGWSCVPDSLMSTAGGCVHPDSDAGTPSSACEPLTSLSVDGAPCSPGAACVQTDASGWAGQCLTVCALDGGSGCEGGGQCQPIVGAPVGAIVGACQ